MTVRRTLHILFFLAVAVSLYGAYTTLQPYKGYPTEVFVDIPRRSGSLEMAQRLAGGGVLQTEWPFLMVRLLRPRSTLKAGEYHFDHPLSPVEVYHKIAAGDVFYHSLTVPEGYSMFEIADAVARTGVLSREEFLLAAQQGTRVADLVSGARTLEGFLFPDTYRLTRHTTADDLAGQMLKRFREVYADLRGAHPTSSDNILETVVLASLVEEETPQARERPQVASAFRNRLRIGMPLQCDPTVIYALQLLNRYRGELTKEDLAVTSPYNTYVHPGLPPGPIANPGRTSLEAAMAPAETDYLYFVADGKGGHVFSASLDRHSEAVASYRRANARRNAKKNARR